MIITTHFKKSNFGGKSQNQMKINNQMLRTVNRETRSCLKTMTSPMWVTQFQYQPIARKNTT